MNQQGSRISNKAHLKSIQVDDNENESHYEIETIQNVPELTEELLL